MTVKKEGEGLHIVFHRLNQKNFHRGSLDGFIRRQEVTECWRLADGSWKLLPISYVEDWDLSQRRQLAEIVRERLAAGGFGYGALFEGGLIGFALVKGDSFGSRGQYLDLEEFHVSEPFRGRGIGGALFRMAAEEARARGAKKLYISAHSAKETMAAYQKLGCVPAQEINRELAEKEPCDVQLEYVL